MLHGTGLGSPEVVGVVEDAQAQAGVDAASPEVFVSYGQLKEGMRMPTPVVMVRTERDPAALTTLVRETVRGIDRAVAVDSIVTMEDRLHTGLACRLAERGVPITKIQYLLGHASVVTTERYIHHTLAELSKAAALLESGGIFDPTAEPSVGRDTTLEPESNEGVQ